MLSHSRDRRPERRWPGCGKCKDDSLHLGPGLSLGSAVYIHVISRLAEVPQEMIFQLSNYLLDTICTFLFSYSQVGLLGQAAGQRFLVEIPNH